MSSDKVGGHPVIWEVCLIRARYLYHGLGSGLEGHDDPKVGYDLLITVVTRQKHCYRDQVHCSTAQKLRNYQMTLTEFVSFNWRPHRFGHNYRSQFERQKLCMQDSREKQQYAVDHYVVRSSSWWHQQSFCCWIRKSLTLFLKLRERTIVVVSMYRICRRSAA